MYDFNQLNSETDHSNSTGAVDDVGHWCDDHHELHGGGCPHSRGHLAFELGPRAIEVYHDLGGWLRPAHLRRRPNSRPGRLQLRSHQRQSIPHNHIGISWKFIKNKKNYYHYHQINWFQFIKMRQIIIWIFFKSIIIYLILFLIFVGSMCLIDLKWINFSSLNFTN